MIRMLVTAIASALLLTSATGAADLELRGTARAAGRPQPNAVVWLDVPTAASTVRPRNKVVLDQHNLSFYPHVLAVRVGTVVDFPNDDRVFHNVFSFRDGKRFDLGLYPVGTVRQVTFDQPGLSRIFCNIHPNMAAYVMAVDSPYFAVSDDNGVFSIASVPAGTYTYHAWRPGGVIITGDFAADPEKPLNVRWP